MLLVLGGRFEQRVGEVADHLPDAGADHAARPVGRAQAGRVALLHFPGELRLRGVRVGDGQLPDPSLGVDDAQGTPVGHERHGQVGDALQGRVVVERRAQGGARLREEGGAPLRGLGLGACALLSNEPGALVLDPLQRPRVPRNQGCEEDQRRHHHERHARCRVVESGALALQAQPAEQRQDPDGGREHAAGHVGSCAVAREDRHHAAPGTAGKRAETQQGEGERRVHADAREAVRGDGVERYPVGVTEEGLPGDQGRGEGQALARAPPARTRIAEEQERDPQEKKAPRLGWRHPPRQRGGDGPRGLPHQQLIDVQVPAERMLAEREQADHRDHPGASLGGAARPRHVVPGLHQPERGAGQDEAEGRVGLHRASPREDAREGSEAEHPPEQDEGADRDDEHARRSREGVEPRDERRIELARAGRHADPRCRRTIVHVRSAGSAVPGKRVVSVQADGARPARCATSVTSSQGSNGLAR